jgi:hypothetical protein
MEFVLPVSRPEASQVYFYDSNSGREAPPFDTRDFVYTRDDPILTVSRSRYSSMLDERNELNLSNGWRSFGMKRLNWDAVPTVHFFQAESSAKQGRAGLWEIAWVWNRPQGAEDLSASGTNILYVQYRMEGELAIATLIALQAGTEKIVWTFKLPDEVPALMDEDTLPPDVPRLRRAFHYAVSAESIFVFGNGFLFALNPATGAVKWKHGINGSRSLRTAAVALNHALVLPAGGDRVALLGVRMEASNPLVSVTGGRNEVVKILRSDLDFARHAVAHDGSIYCFTAEPLKPGSP